MSARTQVLERSRRNLLLLIDGHRTEQALLSSVAGSTARDIEHLAQLGLITRLPSTVAAPAAATPAAAPTPLAHADIDVLLDDAPVAPSYAQLTTRLTQLISSQLGLRGFRLTLAVEKAADVQELLRVADRVVDEIAQRKGAESAAEARRLIHSA